jgi:hypothetical protein
MPRGFHPRRQGDLGEAAAIHWLTSVGAGVSFPLFHSPDYDLVAEIGGQLFKVQVKTSTRSTDIPGRYAVRLATSGGNQSWSGVVKKFDASRCGFLFVLVSDGRSWFIPSAEIEGRHEITLGGPKYSEFEVHPGSPLTAVAPDPGLESDCSPGEYRSGQPGGAVNAVAYAFGGSNPPSPIFRTASARQVEDSRRKRAVSRTRLSANHQLTIPLGPYEAAELEVGDRFRVEAESKGRVVLTRIEEYMERRVVQLALPENRNGSDGNE